MGLDEKGHLEGGRGQADPELALLPITCAEGAELGALAHELSLAGFNVATGPSRSIDPGAYIAGRDQYRADKVLEQARRTTTGRLLAVTDLYLYMPGLSFVFGVADGGGAVVSLYRLRSGAGAALLAHRLLKEALHELGHTFGLGHCEEPYCVMTFSNSLAEVDRKSSRFCNACQGRLNRRG